VTHAPLTLEEHLTGIEAAAERLARWAADAGPDAPVPTCPGWTVRHLLAHQGMVHRWATAIVSGTDPRAVDAEGFEAEGRASADPVSWVRAGADDLVAALRTAPEDLDVATFLKEAPPPLLFWARRQDHETTVHALDALAAREHRVPTADDAWFGPEHALDGIDELLVGFWQRRTKGPRAPAGSAYAATVRADTGERWDLEVTDERVLTRHLVADGAVAEPATGAAPGLLTGPAVDLYLALWNRGGAVEDPAGLLARWRQDGAVTW
jgi:uncharacterized protein (TIGR03083 family)